MGKSTTGSSPRIDNSGNESPQATPLRVFNLARNTWLEGKRISFENLSKAVGVSRVTLYRWQGSREQLIEDIIWSFAKPALDRICNEVPGEGVMHTVEVLRRFMSAAGRFEPLRRFVQANPTTSVRMQTLNTATAHGRLIEATATHLMRQESQGHMALTISARELAELIITTNCALLYGSIIRDEPPDDTIEHASTINYKLLMENTKNGQMIPAGVSQDPQYHEAACYIH